MIDKTTLPPSGDRQDYWHPAPYWWPNPETEDGLPFVRRDGRRVPGTRLYEPESGKYDRTRLQHVFDDSFMLALAWTFSGERRLVEHAARILERFFVDPHTRMTPHLNYAQVRMGHAGDLGTSTGIIEMKDLYYYLDAVRIMQAAGAVSDDSIGRFKQWLKAYLDWLLTSPQGRGERAATNNHGSYYDLQVAAIAAFLDERTVLFDTLARAQSRIAQHFAPDGSQPHELARNTSAHYCCFNFQGWINLAELAGRWNIDLWSYRPTTGASLEQGARWLLGHIGKPWPYEQIDDFDAERFHPILFALPAGFTDTEGVAGVPESRYQAKPRFFPHDGIRPFWNLGSAVAESRSRGTEPTPVNVQPALAPGAFR